MYYVRHATDLGFDFAALSVSESRGGPNDQRIIEPCAWSKRKPNGPEEMHHSKTEQLTDRYVISNHIS